MTALRPLMTSVVANATSAPALDPIEHTPPFTFPNRTSSFPENGRPSKRLSPGLQARLRKLEEQKRRREAERRRQSSIGRIPEEQLAELERLHREQEVIEVQRRGRTWTGPPVRVMPVSGGVRLDGGPMLSEGETSVLESDVSSIISISDRLVASDSEDELADTQKYRLPDPGKTRLHLRTKEPLSPTPRQVPRSPNGQNRIPTPTTPKSSHATTNGNSPSKRNSGVDHVSDSDFISSGISRAGSIYTLGRASFTGQLSQLTSMRLPDANSLAKRISSISTSTEAAKALADASDQIRLWIAKASEVLHGLNAEDDVEWAAAGGRDGIEDVDKAIHRFERLVQVYILSIERLGTREDVASLPAEQLTGSVKQMEGIMASWHKVKQTLKGIKEQVEIAMEWEELWNTILGEVGFEMEGLNRLVFEMEEKRHQGAESLLSTKDSIDLNELETIVEGRPGKVPNSNRFSLPPFSPSSPIQQTQATESKDETSLLELFARMQPLRASLDFLPMRLSGFHIRGNALFPTACLDLEHRRDQLEAQWKKLEGDAESLRRELGEDRWILVFRNAGKQALKMCESIARSYIKLNVAIDAGEHQSNMPALTKMIDNYEAKKMHYGPAIERVLAIIDRGVMERLTVNGEILRLQSDMKRRWNMIQMDIRELDSIIEDIAGSEAREKQLRDSVSTVMSSEQSVVSSLADTAASSPASSIVGTSRKSSFQGSRTPTPLMTTTSRQPSYSQTPASRLASRVPSSSSIPRRTPLTRAADSERTVTSSPSPASVRNLSIAVKPEPSPADNRPRWHGVMKAESRDFLPLSTLEPSPYAKGPVTPKSNFLRSQTRSAPGTRITNGRTVSTPVSLSRPASTALPTRKSSLPVPKSITPARTNSPLAPKSAPLPRISSRMANGRRGSLLALPATDGNQADDESPTHHKSRPPSALASSSSRRGSMLPHRAKSRLDMAAIVGEEKPKWR